MSKLLATIKKIQSVDNLNIVTFECENTLLKMMSLELSKSIQIGSKVSLGIKSTSIGIAKDFSGVLSYSNQLNVVVEEVEDGELLSSIKLSFATYTLESIITRDSVKRMDLQVGDRVTAFIKANELSIIELLS